MERYDSFFIRLRQCVQSGLPAPEHWPSLVAPAIAGTMPQGWVHNQLKSGRAIVLIDGVDEVPILQRQDVHTWLRDFIMIYDQARFIVTSRPPALEAGWTAPEGFDDAELQPMELASIYDFIDHWHAAVREEVQSEEEKAYLEPLASHLKSVVQRSRPLRNLATTHLLCAMLCALNRDRRQQLPSDRIELYEACCWMLMERRDIERRVYLSDYPHLSYRQKRALLQGFADWLLENGWSEVAVQRADERLAWHLAHMDIARGVTGTDVRRLFVDRSGIIREPIAGEIDFTHRTFQEFLAAQAALDEGDIGVRVKNAHDDQWYEVIILAAGLASMKGRGELIRELITRGDQEPQHRHQLHFLAVACLETSIELEPAIKIEVQKRLSQLVPPTNMKEAKALASAGELAVPYLRKSRQMLGSVAAACIRTLVLIGGEGALDAIAGYSSDRRQKMMDELSRGWDSFNREEYARRVLSQLASQQTYLRLSRVSALEGIQYLVKSTMLDLTGYEQIHDLSPLASLTTLTLLNLERCRLISDLGPLTNLPNLTRLDLRSCPQIRELEPLKGLSKLRELFLPDTLAQVEIPIELKKYVRT